ncbi:putative nucleic acid-binding protein [Agromyces terreus]|uniref:Nucleic acid-binding protein n=1 Tax=Agromyces terreus TaxID=424795 RepID=A0A9X2KDN1_9MICO|nr:hypothetical protein [Agromyces terreus]MCP2369747.1 putative nucleic acid-binding protein [Agromyces terreus]
MTRYAIDAAVALRLIRDPLEPSAGRQLVAPSVLRSHVLSRLYTEVRAGRLDERTARAELEGLAELKIRLLGDRVSRSTAFKLATQLDWPDVTPAEYLAVAVLQADALVTDDPVLRDAATGRIPIAEFDDLAR